MRQSVVKFVTVAENICILLQVSQGQQCQGKVVVMIKQSL